MKPVLLIIGTVLPDGYFEKYSTMFTVHYAPTTEDQGRIMTPDFLTTVRGVLTTGTFGLPSYLIEAMPLLEVIACKGAGFEGVDLDAANPRGIHVTHSPGANAPSVAEHALALILATVREIPQTDAAVRRGEWMQFRQYRPLISKKRLGIVGLGNIGAEVAKRAVAGFGMTIGYHGRKPRPGTPGEYRYFATPAALAAESDVLLLSCPGGPGTQHIVDANVLAALGPSGYVVNVSRGSCIDTDALIAAIKNGEIAGAGLDVVDGEPEVPPGLLNLPTLIMTPHLGARSPEGANSALDMAMDNLTSHFDGKPVPNPVPGSTAII